MNSGQKIGMNSAIILKLQKLQKEAPPPPPQKPPPKVEPPKPKEEPIPPPVQQPAIVEEDLDNQFYDQECKEADKLIGNEKNGENADFKKKVKKLNGVMQRLSASVNELKQRYDQAEIQEIMSKKRNKKKEAEALAYVKSQQEQKKAMMKKYAEMKQKQAKKQAEEEAKKQRDQQQEKEKKIQQMKKQMEQKKKDKEKEKKEKTQKQEKAKRDLGKYLQQQPLYQIYQKKQEKRDKKQKQLEKAFLKKRAQKYKPFQLKQFEQHNKLHKQKSKDIMHIRNQQKIEQQQEIMQSNLKLLQKIYRGKTYQMVQQEQQAKEDQKKRKKEKRQRVKKYQSYVKENFQPQTKEEDEDDGDQLKPQSEEEEQEVEEDQNSMKYPRLRKIKRYKYLQGKSCGQIIQTVKMPLSEKLQRRIGDGYLEHVKHLPKKRSSSEQRSSSTAKYQQDLSKKSQVKLIQIPHLPRPKHFSVKISEKPNRDQLQNMIMLLKGNDNQVEFKQKYLCKVTNDRQRYDNVQNQINSNLIENIQRKLSLLTQLQKKGE